MHRYHRRFGGTGTIVTLGDGRAFTAAHCIASVDGKPGTVIDAVGRRFAVVRRWAPARTDLALLRALDGRGRAAMSVAPRVVLRPGVEIVFHGHTGRRFQARRALVTSVTATTATATVLHSRGVCGNDSGGPVFVGDVLVGVAIARAGPPISSRCSSHLVVTRLDSPVMRARIARAFVRGSRKT